MSRHPLYKLAVTDFARVSRRTDAEELREARHGGEWRAIEVATLNAHYGIPIARPHEMPTATRTPATTIAAMVRIALAGFPGSPSYVTRQPSTKRSPRSLRP
jgi:hypothetical protein